MRTTGTVPLTAVTGTITTASSTVGGATDYSAMGSVQVSISGAAHAGVNVIFEGSDDSGTTWYTIAGQREDTNTPESSSGLLPSNGSRSWLIGIGEFNRFRVRATAWTSGTANVRIIAGPASPEPVAASVYSPPAGRVQTIVHLDQEVGANTDVAIATLQQYQGTTATTGLTSITVPQGKIFRIVSLTFTLLVITATTSPWIKMRLRFNPSGAMALGSTLVDQWTIGIPAVTANASSQLSVPLPPEGIELQASATANGGFGFSKSGPATTPANSSISMHLVGYYF